MIYTTYYSVSEINPGVDNYLGLDLTKISPTLKKIVIGSEDFVTYEQCSKHALDFMTEKLEKLGSEFKIYFSKNQFNSDSDFDDFEIIKLFIAKSSQDLEDSPVITKIYFDKKIYFSSTTIH